MSVAEPLETLSASHEQAAHRFFASFGRAIFAACQLQYRLAQLYGATFEELRDGCIPRVHEKRFEGLKNTLGNAIQLAKKSAALTGELIVDLDAAHTLRDYIVHRLFIETRSLQREATFDALAERLLVAEQFFHHVNQRLDEKYTKFFFDAGVPASVLESNRKTWDELEDEYIAPEVPLPKTSERIVAAWFASSQILLESDDGRLWQIADNGLAHSAQPRDPGWPVEPRIQQFLPAGVRARPGAGGSAPEYRGSFNFDLRFDNGAILRISRRGKATLQYEMVPPRGGKKKGKNR